MLNSRSRRSELAVSSTGTCGEGWNCTTLISPSAFAERFASRSRSMDRVPLSRIFDFPRCSVPWVSVKRSGRASSSELEADEDAGLRRFACLAPLPFRALAAQSGVGLIFSNCLRSLRSYSLPPTTSSEAASRSFRRRLSCARETCSVGSWILPCRPFACSPRPCGWFVFRLTGGVFSVAAILALTFCIGMSTGCVVV